jgi:hypothetical protein
VNVGSLVADLRFRVDDDGAQRFDRKVRELRREARDPVEAKLGGKLDRKAFEQYDRELDKIRQRTARRDAFKQELGARFDDRAFRAYERSLKDAERATDRNVRAQGRLRTAFGTVYGRGGALFAAAGGLYGFVQAGKAMVTTAAGIGESISKNRELFGASARSIEVWSKTTADALGISRANALEAAGSFGSLFETVKIADQPAADMSKRLVTLAADLASFNNASPEEALQALRSGLSGEAEPMRRFNALLSEARVKAEAYSSGIAKSGAELTEAQKVQARYNLILKDTKQAQGDAARTANSLPNLLRRFQASVSDVAGEVGVKLLPVLTKATKAALGFVRGMLDGRGAGGRFVRTMRDVAAGIADVARFVRDAAPALAAFAAGFAAFKLVAFVRGLVAARFGIIALTTAMRANPLGVLITALAAAAAGLTVLYKRSETFRSIVKNLADGVLGAISTILTGVGKFVEAMAGVPILGDKFKGVGKAVRGAADDIDRFREKLRGDHGYRELRRQNRLTAESFKRLAGDADTSLDDIRKTTASNMARIKKEMDSKSKEGREALAENFRGAISAVSRQMARGGKVTKEGLDLIREYMTEELRTYGIPLRIARRIAARRASGESGLQSGSGRSSPTAGGGAQRGGWIGAKGLVGPDTVRIAPNTWAAPGEYLAKGPRGLAAVLNRHQAPIVNLALNAGGYGGLDALPGSSALPIIERAMRPFGGLDSLFALVNRPHMLQRGGIVELGRQLQRQGYQVGEHPAFGGVQGRHAPNSYHYRAQALDINADGRPGGEARWLDRLAAQLRGSGWHILWRVAGHYDHLHVDTAGGGGGTGGFGGPVARIPRIRIGGGGALGAVVQRGLDVATAAAQRVLDAAGGPDGAGHPNLRVTGAGGDVISAFRRAIRAAGASPVERLALWEAGIVESGLRNLSYGDRDSVGVLQERSHYGSVARRMNPFLAAMRFLREAAALRPWRGSAGMLAQAVQRSAFPGRYDQVAGQARQYLRRGGRVRRRLTRMAGVDYPSGSAAFGEQQATLRGLGPSIQGLRRLQRGRGGELERLEAEIRGLDRQYGQAERGFGFNAWEFVSDDGTLNQGAIERRVAELEVLVGLRQEILKRRERVKVIAERMVRTYHELVSRITRALGVSRGERRTRYEGQLRQAREGLASATTAAEDAGFDVQDTRLDLHGLWGEIASVRGTQPRLVDTTATGPTDPGAGVPSADEIARGVMEQLAQFQAGRADLFRGFGSNAIGRGAFGGAFMDTSQQAAGLRHFGAFAQADAPGVAGGFGQRPVIQHITISEPPPDPHAFTRTLQFAAQTEMV